MNIKKIAILILACTVFLGIFQTAYAAGNMITNDLWIRAIINTDEKGAIEAVWQEGGEDFTARGDRVIWGYFYAAPSDVDWGNPNNPDIFVKIWFDAGGRVDVNFFHVSVPEMEVYSGYPYNGDPDEQGILTVDRRYIRHWYKNGQSDMQESYEDGLPPEGYSQADDSSAYFPVGSLKIAAKINTVEKGAVDASWYKGGEEMTEAGHKIIWGYFYANPEDVAWGSADNPDLFFKVWFDADGRADVNFFHVSVPDIDVYSGLSTDGQYEKRGTTVLDSRYIRHEYWPGSMDHETAMRKRVAGTYFVSESSGNKRLWTFTEDGNVFGTSSAQPKFSFGTQQGVWHVCGNWEWEVCAAILNFRFDEDGEFTEIGRSEVILKFDDDFKKLEGKFALRYFDASEDPMNLGSDTGDPIIDTCEGQRITVD